ncbi:MAG: PLP-dependent enzyme glutamate decarboxylase, partial [Ilumatobacteraceae bacterium]|nr:PLP-dependent enzyme glutamate decarboxylase [Ilumatobacteraceae bacterium]
MVLPAVGVPANEVLSRLDELKRDDVKWRDGRAFTLVYNAGPDVVAIAEEAYRRFGADNALNTDAFPSLRRIQADVVDMVGDWLQAGPDGAGFMTTGGTESILMAVKAARERGRKERGITTPNVVLPTSAHAAFEKGCYYFGLESRRVPVRADWRADVDAMGAAIDDHTVLVVGSAPQYPQGVVDPIAEIAALAAERDINCHVDACMGGVTLTYLERLGHIVPPWNFAVDGVTSMSVDLHKYGYTAKGASVIMHRNKRLRAHQTFVTDNWLGGTYGSSGVMGTKSGGPMAAAWAVMNHLGDDGYMRLTASARTACEQLVEGIEAIDGLELLAAPDTTLFAVRATDPTVVDVFAVADGMWRRGWYIDRQGPPASLH